MRLSTSAHGWASASSRDGRTILFAANKPANDDLYLIENFR